ncbi:UNVERIFIED_CONTAM: hypothetical protein FKN15_051142 [Acipenser sinensis]
MKPATFPVHTRVPPTPRRVPAARQKTHNTSHLPSARTGPSDSAHSPISSANDTCHLNSVRTGPSDPERSSSSSPNDTSPFKACARAPATPCWVPAARQTTPGTFPARKQASEIPSGSQRSHSGYQMIAKRHLTPSQRTNEPQRLAKRHLVPSQLAHGPQRPRAGSQWLAK